jgi:hypothetical protein
MLPRGSFCAPIRGTDCEPIDNMIADGIDQRHQARRGSPDPVGKRGDTEIDTLAGIDLALPIQRQMRPVFAEQDLRQELRSGATAGDRMERRRRRGDGLAFAAGELLPRILEHFPARRNIFQRLGDVFAQLAQGDAATSAAASSCAALSCNSASCNSS